VGNKKGKHLSGIIEKYLHPRISSVALVCGNGTIIVLQHKIINNQPKVFAA
jgi:hypothetical protein